MLSILIPSSVCQTMGQLVSSLKVIISTLAMAMILYYPILVIHIANIIIFAKNQSKSDFTIITVRIGEVRVWKISKLYQINSVFSTFFCNLQLLSLNSNIFGELNKRFFSSDLDTTIFTKKNYFFKSPFLELLLKNPNFDHCDTV